MTEVVILGAVECTRFSYREISREKTISSAYEWIVTSEWDFARKKTLFRRKGYTNFN